MGVDVLHTDPAGQRQRGVCPDPVHHCPQLREEGHQAKTVDNIQKLSNETDFQAFKLNITQPVRYNLANCNDNIFLFKGSKDKQV